MELIVKQPDWQALAATANADPETRLALKNAQFCAAVVYGEQRILLEADDGAIRLAAPTVAPDFEVRAPVAAWDDYVAGPTIEANTPLSMARQGHLSSDGRIKSEFEFDGDQRKLWANFRALDLVFQQLRQGRG